MTDPLCLVVNPAAGNGRALRAMPAVLTALTTAGGPAVRVCESTSLSHAADCAVDAVGRGETVVAVGGDGLVGTLAGAVAGAGGVLGLIPAGRGNDFARMLGIPRVATEAARALMAGEPQPVDLIGVRAGDGPEATVAGSVYLGIVSEGGEIANRARWVRGPLGYQLAGVRALLAWQRARFTLDVPGPGDVAGQAGAANGNGNGNGNGEFPGYCVVVANSGYLAAGVKAAPGADVSDGLLDVLTVEHGSRSSFLKIMRRAAKGGHVGMDLVGMRQAASVTVRADRAMPAAADGETLPFASPLPPGIPLTIRALPSALRIIRPAAPGQ
ncbi:MAG: diacylglycerol/lipid kinase family protein [Gemmatimonadota bacterium]